MALRVSYVEATNRKTGKKSLTLNVIMRLIRKRFMKNSVFLVLQGRQLLLLSPNNSTYVFRKINEQEFKLAKDSQKCPVQKATPRKKVK